MIPTCPGTIKSQVQDLGLMLAQLWAGKAHRSNLLALCFYKSKTINIFHWVIFITMENKNKFAAFRWNSHSIKATYWNVTSLQMVTAAMKLKKKKMLAPWKKTYDKPRQCIKKHRYHFADKGPYSQGYGFSSSHVQKWELDHKVGWALKNWCFRIVVLEKTLESPLNSKNIKSVNPEGNQPWIFIGRTDAEAEAPILWPPD